MRRNLIDSIVKLLLVSLMIGIAFSLLGVDPWRHLGPLGSLSGNAIKAGTALFGWAWTYVVVGSALVVPIWLLYEIIVYLRRS